MDKQLDWCWELLDKIEDSRRNSDGYTKPSNVSSSNSFRSHAKVNLSPRLSSGNTDRKITMHNHFPIQSFGASGSPSQYRSKTLQSEDNFQKSYLPYSATLGRTGRENLRKTYSDRDQVFDSYNLDDGRFGSNTIRWDKYETERQNTYTTPEITKIKSEREWDSGVNETGAKYNSVSDRKSQKFDSRKYCIDSKDARVSKANPGEYSNTQQDTEGYGQYSVTPVIRRTVSHPVSSKIRENEKNHSFTRNYKTEDVTRPIHEDGYCSNSRAGKESLYTKQLQPGDESAGRGRTLDRSSSRSPKLQHKNKPPVYCTTVTIVPERCRSNSVSKNKDNIALLKSYQLRGKCSFPSPGKYYDSALQSDTKDQSGIASSNLFQILGERIIGETDSSVRQQKTVVRSISADSAPESRDGNQSTGLPDAASEINILNKLRSNYFTGNELDTKRVNKTVENEPRMRCRPTDTHSSSLKLKAQNNSILDEFRENENSSNKYLNRERSNLCSEIDSYCTKQSQNSHTHPATFENNDTCKSGLNNLNALMSLQIPSKISERHNINTDHQTTDLVLPPSPNWDDILKESGYFDIFSTTSSKNKNKNFWTENTETRIPRSTSSPQLESRRADAVHIPDIPQGFEEFETGIRGAPDGSSERQIFDQLLEDKKILNDKHKISETNLASLVYNQSVLDSNSISLSEDNLRGDVLGRRLSKHRSSGGKTSQQNYSGKFSKYGSSNTGGMEFLLENITLKTPSKPNNLNEPDSFCYPNLDRSKSGSCYSIYENDPRKRIIFNEQAASSDPQLTNLCLKQATQDNEEFVRIEKICASVDDVSTEVAVAVHKDGLSKSLPKDLSKNIIPINEDKKKHESLTSTSHNTGINQLNNRSSLPAGVERLSALITTPGQNRKNDNKQSNLKSGTKSEENKIKKLTEAERMKESPSIDSLKIGCGSYANRIREQCRKLSSRITRSTSAGSRAKRSARRIQKEDVEAFQAAASCVAQPAAVREAKEETKAVKEIEGDLMDPTLAAETSDKDSERPDIASDEILLHESTVPKPLHLVASDVDSDLETLTSVLASMDMDETTTSFILAARRQSKEDCKNGQIADKTDLNSQLSESSVKDSLSNSVNDVSNNNRLESRSRNLKIINTDETKNKTKFRNDDINLNLDTGKSNPQTSEYFDLINSYSLDRSNLDKPCTILAIVEETELGKTSNKERIIYSDESCQSLQLARPPNSDQINLSEKPEGNISENRTTENTDKVDKIKNLEDKTGQFSTDQNLTGQKLTGQNFTGKILSEKSNDDSNNTDETVPHSPSITRQASTLSRTFSLPDDVEMDPWWSKLDASDQDLLDVLIENNLTAISAEKCCCAAVESICKSISEENSEACWRYIQLALFDEAMHDVICGGAHGQNLQFCRRQTCQCKLGDTVSMKTTGTCDCLQELRKVLENQEKLLQKRQSRLKELERKSDEIEKQLIKTLQSQQDQKCLERFQSFIKQLMTVISLVTQLSSRLSAADLSMKQLPADCTAAQKKRCSEKRDQLMERYTEAVEAKHGVDRTCRQISAYFRKILPAIQFESYQSFVRCRHFIKPRLLVTASDIELIDKQITHLKTLTPSIL